MKNNTENSYDKIAKFYNSPFIQFYYFFAHRHCTYFLKNYLKNNITVLDVACGTGIFLNKINHERKGLHLFGIDNSKNMISIAKKNYATIHFETADADKIPFEDNSFDLITIIDAFYYFRDKESTLKECSRVLKPNGYLFIFYMAIDIFPKFILKLIQLISIIFSLNSEGHSTFPKMNELKKMADAANLKLITKKLKIVHTMIPLHRFILFKKD